jgi:hypothetical protein
MTAGGRPDRAIRPLSPASQNALIDAQMGTSGLVPDLLDDDAQVFHAPDAVAGGAFRRAPSTNE